VDPSIRFTTDLNGILQDHEVGLVVICTHLDSHVEYATAALENNKHALLKSLSHQPLKKQIKFSNWQSLKAILPWQSKTEDLTEISLHFKRYLKVEN